jgi:hypothetical protein
MLVPPSRTTDTATWKTTSAFLSVSQRWSGDRVAPSPFSVGTNSIRVALIAGARPNATPVRSEIATAKIKTR